MKKFKCINGIGWENIFIEGRVYECVEDNRPNYIKLITKNDDIIQKISNYFLYKLNDFEEIKENRKMKKFKWIRSSTRDFKFNEIYKCFFDENTGKYIFKDDINVSFNFLKHNFVKIEDENEINNCHVYKTKDRFGNSLIKEIEIREKIFKDALEDISKIQLGNQNGVDIAIQISENALEQANLISSRFITCIKDNVVSNGLTKGKRYKLRGSNRDMYYILDDNGELDTYHKDFFK